MPFLDIVRFIWSHPLASRNRGLAFSKFFSWQIGQRVFNNRPVLYPLVEDSVLLVRKGMAGATGNIYTGLAEFEEMAVADGLGGLVDQFGGIFSNNGDADLPNACPQVV